jgi:hypothetical protein
MTPFTILLDGRAVRGGGLIREGRVLLDGGTAWKALSSTVDVDTDLADLAGHLGRPLAVDPDEGVALLGVSARARRERLLSLDAPDFTLPDLDGRSHGPAEHRGKKVFLVAYASW